jgi:hypothetical protein
VGEIRGGFLAATSCRITELDFDVAASAGWYSAIAGVLAGFALLAILLPLDHEAADPDAAGHGADGVVILVCAFFSLLISSFAYAILAGRSANTPQGAAVAAHEQLINGITFGLTTLLLLFALRSILASYGTNRAVFLPAQQIILSGTAILGPVVLLSFQFANAVDVERLRLDRAAETCGPFGIPSGVWVNLAITVAALAAIAVLAVVRHRLATRDQATIWIAKGVLGFTVAAIAWSSIVLPLLPVDVVGGAVVEHLLVALSAAATVLVAAASWSGR